MIQKIINIKNIGKFKDCNPHGSILWSQTTAIYADNGSGKTTLTQIIKSMRGGYDELNLSVRKTFDSTDNMQAKFLLSEDGIFNLNTRWDKKKREIVVFDSFYIDDNVYVISLGDPTTTLGSFAEIVLGKDFISNIEQIRFLGHKTKNLGVAIRHLRSKMRSNQKEGISDDSIAEAIAKKIELKNNLNMQKKKLAESLIHLSETYGVSYIDKINKYLKRLGTGIKLSRLVRRGNLFVYHIQINEISVRDTQNNVSLKKTLSEGEKNCLAFAFFLARLDLLPDLKEQIVVFDDPISSLDSRRRAMTLSILCHLATRVKQLIILSHDINFIKDYCDRNSTTKTLCIKETSNGSIIEEFDTKASNRTGIFLDVEKIRAFSIDGSSARLDPRDVIRCIRPTLEGLLRIKFMGLLNDKEWLGNFLNKIREADSNSPFYRYKDIIIDIEDLNDYTKAYHHSNPTFIEAQINENELKQKCKDTLDLILKI